MPRTRHLAGARTQNCENNPMQSRDSVSRRPKTQNLVAGRVPDRRTRTEEKATISRGHPKTGSFLAGVLDRVIRSAKVAELNRSALEDHHRKHLFTLMSLFSQRQT